MNVQQIYKKDEDFKSTYGDRIRNVEKASFTPLIFTTTGGMGPECLRFNKRLAEKLANKQKEKYSHVVRHIRTRIRFALLKATLIAIRGERGPSRKGVIDLGDVMYNLIPQLRLLRLFTFPSLEYFSKLNQ